MHHKIFDMAFSSIYPHYVTKVTKKGRSVEELNQLIFWHTGYDEQSLQEALLDHRSNKDFFEKAPQLNALAHLVKGNICGVRVENIEDPLMRNIRILDKLVDDCAKGKPLDKIFPKE
jgi:hypothetical protein